MSSKNIDFTILGKKFGLLTVVAYDRSQKRTWWRCHCECGSWTIVRRKTLTDYCSPDRPLSCGCIAKENAGNSKKVPIEEAALRKYQDLLTFREIKGKCWEWGGYMQKGRTPKTSWKNRVMGVRKCMYLILNHITHEKNSIYPSCGNLRCFNPDHLTFAKPSRRKFYVN